MNSTTTKTGKDNTECVENSEQNLNCDAQEPALCGTESDEDRDELLGDDNEDDDYWYKRNDDDFVSIEDSEEEEEDEEDEDSEDGDMIRGHNNDLLHADTGNALLDFFAKAGSLFEKRDSYYGEETSALDLFKAAWNEDEKVAMQLLFWLRDCRGGAGNRSAFRAIIAWLAQAGKGWVLANLSLIPLYGRWDDLLALQGTECEAAAFALWAEAILAGDSLASKWAPRADKKKAAFNLLRRAAGMQPGDFRRLLARQTKVVETLMCERRFAEIDYNKVPSVAMARHNKAFAKRDKAGFSAWKDGLCSGETIVNASVLLPHDVLRTMREDSEQPSRLAEAQFAALPDYMAANNLRIMPVCDFSGSMRIKISGSISALDISMGLGLYCSDRVGKENPFYRMLIPFSKFSNLISWRNMSFCEAVSEMNVGYCGETDIEAVLRNILNTGIHLGASNEEMPNCLLIISDMQFNGAANGRSSSAISLVMKEWQAAGYDIPRIVFWNTAGYAGSPASAAKKNVALISGFSPAILKAALTGRNTPVEVMLCAVEKYQLKLPEKN